MTEHLPFLNPRPTRDPRIIAINAAMMYVCAVQAFAGPAPDSVNAKALVDVNLAYLALLMVSSGFLLVSAILRSEYAARSVEMIGAVGATFVYSIFAVGAAATVYDWSRTQGAAWAIAFALGSGVRVVQLAWQFTPKRWRARILRVRR